jgi:hypothetical protein
MMNREEIIEKFKQQQEQLIHDRDTLIPLLIGCDAQTWFKNVEYLSSLNSYISYVSLYLEDIDFVSDVTLLEVWRKFEKRSNESSNRVREKLMNLGTEQE